MNRKTKVSNRKKVDKAVAILELLTEDESVYVNHDNRRLEATVSSPEPSRSRTKIRQTLGKLAKTFNCGYSSRLRCSYSGGSEDGYYYSAYTEWIHEFKPTRITTYEIYVTEYR